MKVRLTGDWNKLHYALGQINTRLMPQATLKVYEDGDMVLEKLQGHIEAQDLGWKPVKTYSTGKWWVETGELTSGMEALRVSKGTGRGVFVGFLADKQHHSGESAAELAVFIEETHALVEPTWKEVKETILSSWKDFIIEFVRGL